MSLRHFFLFLCVLSLLSPSILATSEETENSPPTLAGRVTPPRTYGGAEFLFTVTYKDADNDTALFVRVVIEGTAYEMTEVNPNEDNYTAGKDYSFRKAMPDGPAMFYFTASDGNITVSTTVQTLYAEPVGILSGEHRDIILFTGLITPFFLAAILFLTLQLRGIRKSLKNSVVEAGNPPTSNTDDDV